jgi:hypothetical protein
MSQDHYISTGPINFVTEEAFHMTVLRGLARFEVEVEVEVDVDVARVEGTSLGKELLQQIEL